MTANRYGQIWHGDHHHINIRFPSNEARLKFQNEFEAYHGSHDHEGDVPTFRNVASKDLKFSTGSRSPEDLVKAETDEDYRITLDGYGWSDIHEYHNPSGFRRYFWYHVPTCCVPPIIVVDHEFVDSNTLQRHELSAIFGDMPETDFQSLLNSVQTDGFIDPILRLHEGKILDGWHRYRAAQELNLIRRLKFQEWNENEKKDGDPKAFVLARNIERRHFSPQQRAQIVVTFNERFNRGDIDSQRSDSPQGEPKTRLELAQDADVGTRTIDRAIAVDKAGQSEAVIAGEKSVSEVLKEREAQKLLKQKKQKAKLLWDTRIQVARDYTGDADTELNLHTTLPELEEGFKKNNPQYAFHFTSAMKRTSEVSYQVMLGKILESEDVTLKVLETEVQAIQTYRGDINQWERSDWSPATNWILPLIAAKKTKAAETETADATETDETDTLKTLREQVRSEMPKWKERYQKSGKQESKLVSRASFSMLISVYRGYRASSESDAATAAELKDLYGLLKCDSFPFLYRLREEMRGKELPAENRAFVCESQTKGYFTVHRQRNERNPRLSDDSENLPLQNAVEEMKAENAYEHTLLAIEKLKDGFKQAHVVDIAEFVDDILYFYNGVGVSDLSTCPQETLKNISDFIEGFVHEPLQAWPEYIRNHRRIPKRELVLVSIGINNHTDDEFEMVEFTDENSDEITCELNALPEDLRTALLKVASEKIYVEEVKEFHTDG